MSNLSKKIVRTAAATAVSLSFIGAAFVGAAAAAPPSQELSRKVNEYEGQHRKVNEYEGQHRKVNEYEGQHR